MIVNNKKILASILFAFLSFFCAAAHLQELPPPQVLGGPPPPPPAPIDDGLIILFAVAVMYGIYRTLKASKKSTKA